MLGQRNPVPHGISLNHVPMRIFAEIAQQGLLAPLILTAHAAQRRVGGGICIRGAAKCEGRTKSLEIVAPRSFIQTRLQFAPAGDMDISRRSPHVSSCLASAALNSSILRKG